MNISRGQQRSWVEKKIEDSGMVSGEFVEISGEPYYAIRNIDKMPPFLISVVSDSDHWMFISSNGGLTAGRVSPETSLFPYITVDKIYDSAAHTGSKTLLRVRVNDESHEWEPFNVEHNGRYEVTRNLYKNLLGNKLCFEEINHDLKLQFRYTWSNSDSFGFVRKCELQNLANQSVTLDMLDGLQNILPANIPSFIQSNASNLLDAYKWSELDEQNGIAYFTVYSGITDKPEPCESLKANTVFCLGLDGDILISSEQVDSFRRGEAIYQEQCKRGMRGSYLVSCSLNLKAKSSKKWQLVANIEQPQSNVAALRREIADPLRIVGKITKSIKNGSDSLARIMGSADAFQLTADTNVDAHHYANVLFNVLRGGIFDDQYHVYSIDFSRKIKRFNSEVYDRNRTLLHSLPEKIELDKLRSMIREQGDFQLERLSCKYLPITFGRRHGDPSRPWNKFAIILKDEFGKRLLSYQGNWRDIFQNWEALLFSYPEFASSVIAKFVNASTMDGYNPYRVTKEGIDWEVEDPNDPWSYIGYWGDHQIIYLLKLIELLNDFHPERLQDMLHQPVFCYANVPYRIKPFEDLLRDAKNTVVYDNQLAAEIERRVENMGADGKLVLDANGEVYQVNLVEKLLVPLLAKLGNLVIGGGIWLNTQRPEWNDANNALVGQGLSMVTLYYMRRYIHFLKQLLMKTASTVVLSKEVSQWLADSSQALNKVRPHLDAPLSPEQRYQTLAGLGEAACRYRADVYRNTPFTGKTEHHTRQIIRLLDDAQAAIDHSIAFNQREDGLYHAYNTMNLKRGKIRVERLYAMLEGQVAVLSSGTITPQSAVEIVEALFDSDMYRADQQSFMLYPDRKLPGFMDKNRIPAELLESIPLVKKMIADKDERIVLRDVDGVYRFHAAMTNINALNARLSELAKEYGDAIDDIRGPLQSAYEAVFHHQAFTGRSGGMFGFEGLGSIYWHMVSKLLLAVQENYFSALEQGADEVTIRKLGELYYRVRKGIGFNKTPAEYGAFPTDPYSHTPKHAGAQQPGMTGQVKEEVLTRFGELGVRVRSGAVQFQPSLLQASEFTLEPKQFRYLDVNGNWQVISVPVGGLAFTWCQVPIVYQLAESCDSSVTITWNKAKQTTSQQSSLSIRESAELFKRSGQIQQIDVVLQAEELFND